jgi:hypothetical protein
MLAYLYSHISAIIMKLDMINKKVLGLQRDYNMENAGKGLLNIGKYYNEMSQSFH